MIKGPAGHDPAQENRSEEAEGPLQTGGQILVWENCDKENHSQETIALQTTVQILM